ncbi:transcription initiation factor IIA subunit 1-like isoform X2 [Oncorhynchus keta]|uniref:transcription initiation factor IIA subunit 1-like isoform X2 n=1 Tax=Oncorhynchus keta TaxID=8018 RepID=UPI00227D082F|nr:transcription initiation factor IIA subunit 1-like isoform X2 [Oncorhynchus keta]
MASSANSNQVPKLYRSVIEDVINEVRELFLDEGVDEQVLMELKTLWENKLMQSKAVEGFNTEEQAALQAAAQQQAQQAQQATQQAQTQQVLLPPQQQVTSWQSTRPTVTSAPQQQVIVQDPKILQHMSATGMSAATTAATLALPTGISPYQQLITSQGGNLPQTIYLKTVDGQILQVLRAANGTQYIIQPQQQMVLQQQVLPQMQPGGGQAPVIQQVLAPLQGGLPQVLAPLQGGLPQQTGVIIQPQQVILTGNKVHQNAQVMQMTGQPGQVQQIQQQVQQVQQVQGGAAPGGPQQQQQIQQQVQQVQQVQGGAAPGGPQQQQQIQQQVQQVQQVQGGAAPGGPQQQQQIQQQVQQVQQVQGGAAPGVPQQQQQPPMMLQVDGAGDTSSEDEDEEEEYDEEEDEEKEKDGEDGQVEEEPLNSEDDVSDEEDQELFDTENVVVCQYDKIHRSKNKWKFHLKDGIMNLNGRDYVFSKAIGDAECLQASQDKTLRIPCSTAEGSMEKSSKFLCLTEFTILT